MKAEALALALLATLASAPARANWITTWAASPVTPGPAVGPLPAAASFSNVTLRQILRVSAGGRAVRIRFTNAYGPKPLAIGAARVALLDANGVEVAGSSRTLRFGGSPQAIMPRGGPLVSDEVALSVPPLARLAVSLYLPDDTGPCTCHATGLDDTEVSAPGDHSAAPFTPASVNQSRAFLAAVEVDTPQSGQTVVVFGDSISDGVGSTPKANRRWPDVLAERLVKRSGATWGVANAGISGNRVLQDFFGDSALARLDRDALAVPGVAAIILFEGVNDLGFSFGRFPGAMGEAMAPLSGRKVDAAQIIAGYRQIVARAHAQGVKVYGATIAPYKGAATWTAEGEAERGKINAFIRTGGLFDGVVDFDKIVRDPADPAAMRADYHMGDHLHGNDVSYRAMGEAIDLSWFGKTR